MITRATSRGTRGLLALAAGVLLLGGAATAPAGADTVSCGDTVTRDVTLAADLLDCPGFGLVIGADGITVDLAGHVIDGVGGGGVGIRSHGFADVRIEDGTIREFGTGISLGRAPSFPGGSERGPAATRNVLRRLVVVQNGAGVRFFRVFDNTLERSVVAHNAGVGVEVADALSGRNRVERNVVVGNRDGVSVTQMSSRTVVTDNRVVDNERHGIAVLSLGPFTPTENLIAENVAEDNGADGIAASGGGGNVLERNRARRNGDDGIDVGCEGPLCPAGVTTLTRNVADRNADLGIEADERAGDGGGNRARRNGNDLQCTGVRCS